jgi:hypothetical protein
MADAAQNLDPQEAQPDTQSNPQQTQPAAGQGGNDQQDAGQQQASNQNGEGTQDAAGDQGQGSQYWPADWRQKMAEAAGAGDAKAVARELKRLERITDPAAVFGMYREVEGRLTRGGLVQVPGKDAKPEDVAAFRKALGMPEKWEDMVGGLKLANGLVLGDLDKPAVEQVAQAMHGATTPQEAFTKAVEWYLQTTEQQAAALDEQDEQFKGEGIKALKEEWGPAYQRNVNAMAALFATAPGGVDLDNDSGLFARLAGGRMADGRRIGDDPDFIRWAAGLAREINPVMTVTDGSGGGKSMDAEIKEIESIMRADRRSYNKDANMQARYRELIEAREKDRARNAR